MYQLFHTLVLAHILVGSVGLLAFWVPVIAQKGGVNHQKWGRVFTWSMLITGTIAFTMSTCTLLAPVETHPHLDGQMTMTVITGIFGWMMQYLAILTINLAWYGWLCVINKRDHAKNREWRNVALQFAVMIAALNCAVQGWLIDDPMISSLMMGISVVGVATGVTNLWFIYKPNVGRHDWQYEHIKALVGAGISVYTAFFAFGAVRLMPELALNPLLWAVPLVTGLAIILFQWRKLWLRFGSSGGGQPA
jgi:hypothetical protein